MAIKFETLSKAQARVNRRPRHTFNIITRPWQIQPFMIAPVLPGETMKNLLHQSRTVSKPVLNPLIGWWLEHYYFYVKLRDLDDRATIENMILDTTTSTAALNTAAAAWSYHPAGSIDWVQKCLKPIVEHFFRVSGESWTISTIDNVPVASLGIRHFLESATNEDPFIGAATFDQNVDLNADTTIKASEVDRALRTWQFMAQNKLTEMTFEDYLRSYGIKVPEPDEPYKPELLRFFRQWAYPTNHVSPTNGVPSSAMVWATEERADKDRFFIEPGFVLGVQVARPKVYLSRQTAAGSHMLDNAMAWMPPAYMQDRFASFKRFAAAAGYPILSTTDDIWIDVKDLFLHGDQFVNYAVGTAGFNHVSFPAVGDPDIDSAYPGSASADSLFAAAAPANTLNTDGVVDLTIAGQLSDLS